MPFTSQTLGSGCCMCGLGLMGGQLPEVCQKRCLAMPHIALGRLSRRQPLTCDVMLPRWAPHRCAWSPRSLHTAEVTGSIPVTPTSTNAFLGPRGDAGCQQVGAVVRWDSKPPPGSSDLCPTPTAAFRCRADPAR